MLQTVWIYEVAASAGLIILALLLSRLRKVRSKAAVIGGVTAALIGVSVFAAYQSEETQRVQVMRHVEVIRNTKRVVNVTVLGEDSQRGYLLSGDKQYLTAFRDARRELDVEVRTLRARLSSELDLATTGSNLAKAALSKFDLLDAVVRAFEQSGLIESLRIAQAQDTAQVTRLIETAGNEIVSVEEAAIAQSKALDQHLEVWISIGCASLLLAALATLMSTARQIERDVAAHRRIIDELSRQNEMFALAGESANLGHWSFDAASRRSTWSPTIWRIFGLHPEDEPPDFERIIGCYLPDDRPTVLTCIEQAMVDGKDFQFEARLRKADGTAADVICRGKCHKDAGGSVTSMFGIFIDVTDIRRQERSLRKSEHRYRLLAENVTDMIIRYDADRRFIFVSPSSLRLLGRQPDEMVGAMMGDFIHPDDRAEAVRYLAALGTAPGEAIQSFEYRLSHTDGSWVWVEATASRYVDAADREGGSIAVIRDHRQRKQAQDRLRAATEAAEDAKWQAVLANQAKSDFLAAMSHELRTPLNSIIGFTDLMLDNRDLVGDLRYQAEVVNSSGAALLTIINDVLDFSKIEAGKVEIEAVPFSPGALVSNALAIVRGMAVAKELDLSSTIDPTLPKRLVSDPNRIQQVLLNLLNNAIKFTSKGSVTLNVRVDDRSDLDGHGPDPTKLRVSIIDTGIGISDSKQNRLFQRFSQADASISRDYGGTGLGLAISKRLVELMGGEVGVFSREGQGSNFWFTLPLDVAEAPLPVAVPSLPHASRRGRLLLVEDVKVNQVLACSMLEGDGHTVDVVDSGEAAIHAVQANRYDLVLMDVQMPGMGGIAATRSIRALPGCADLPIIALTATVMTEQVSAFREAGMDDHVHKPIIRADLRKALDRWLDRSRRPDASSTEGDEPFDAAVFEQITALLGPDKTRETLKSFQVELDGRLSSTDVELSRHGTFKADAHAIASVAGMIGFPDLAQACIEIACLDKAQVDEFTKLLPRVLRAKEAAAAKLAQLRQLCAVPGDDLVHQRPKTEAMRRSETVH